MSGTSKPYFSMVKLWFDFIEKVKLSLFDRISTELVYSDLIFTFRFQPKCMHRRTHTQNP